MPEFFSTPSLQLCWNFERERNDSYLVAPYLVPLLRYAPGAQFSWHKGVNSLMTEYEMYAYPAQRYFFLKKTVDILLTKENKLEWYFLVVWTPMISSSPLEEVSMAWILVVALSSCALSSPSLAGVSLPQACSSYAFGSFIRLVVSLVM